VVKAELAEVRGTRLADFLYDQEAHFLSWRFSLDRLSIVTKRSLKRQRKGRFRSERSVFRRALAYLSHPDHWLVSVLLVFVIMALPQLLIPCVSIQLPGANLLNPSPNQQDGATYTYSLSSILQSAWQVLAGLLGTTFAIAIFLVEYTHQSSGPARTLPFFAVQSNMLLVLGFGVLSRISSGFRTILVGNSYFDQTAATNIAVLNLLIFTLNLLTVVHLYAKTFQFVQPEFWDEAVSNQIRNDALNSVETEITRRVSIRTLQEFCEGIGVEFSYFDRQQKDGWFPVSARLDEAASSEVTDVNLKLLGLAAKRAHDLSTDAKIVLAAYPGRVVSRGRCTIAHLSPTVAPSRISHLLKASIQTAKRTRSTRQAAFAGLGFGHDIIADAIDAGRPQVVRKTLDLYLDTLEEFLNVLERYGVQYAPDMVRRESSILGGWNLVNVVRRQYRSLVHKALHCDDRHVAAQFIYFSFRVMRLAYEHSDFLLFKRFSGFYEAIYLGGHSLPAGNQIRDLAYDRCWRGPIEFYNVVLSGPLSRQATEEQVGTFAEYAVEIIMLFNRLAKRALDFRDQDRFKDFVSAAKTIPGNTVRRSLRHTTMLAGSTDPQKLDHLLSESKALNQEHVEDKNERETPTT